jgi:hypothetical protein
VAFFIPMILALFLAGDDTGETAHMTLCFRRRNRALKFQSRK